MTGSPRFIENARVIAGVFFLSALLSGCTVVFPQTAELRDRWPADLPLKTELTDVPFFPQTEYQCGPAALATTLAHLSVPVTADDLAPQLYIPARKGTLQIEMLAAPRRYGIVSYKLEPRIAEVLREIAAGNPVIVLKQYSHWPILKLWHYAVAVGYNGESGTMYFRSGENERLTLPIGMFEFLWKDGAQWAMVATPPGRIPATADRARFFDSIVALERAKQPKAAAATYQAFLERWPGDLGASIGLANAHYALGDLEGAETALRAAVERHPDSPVVLNNLAHVLSERGRSEEALAVIDRAGAEGPHAGSITGTRALILQRLQKRN
jgi:hypothetical protein